MKIGFLLISVCFISACAGPAITGEGDARGGDVRVDVHQTEYGSYCHTDAGSCGMQIPGILGTACTCFTPYGPVVGEIGRR